jgi:hypothetical protein
VFYKSRPQCSIATADGCVALWCVYVFPDLLDEYVAACDQFATFEINATGLRNITRACGRLALGGTVLRPETSFEASGRGRFRL